MGHGLTRYVRLTGYKLQPSPRTVHMPQLRIVYRNGNERPQLAYGRDRADGITFHTFRHTAATVLADLEVPAEKRQQLLGHLDLASTMLYTHMRPRHELPVAEQLSAALPLEALVTDRRIRAKSVGTPDRRRSDSFGKKRERSESREGRKIGLTD
jgi:Phage integrase family